MLDLPCELYSRAGQLCCVAGFVGAYKCLKYLVITVMTCKHGNIGACPEGCDVPTTDRPDPLDDDRDQEQPIEYTEKMNWDKHDFDNDPDWR